MCPYQACRSRFNNGTHNMHVQYEDMHRIEVSDVISAESDVGHSTDDANYNRGRTL